MDPLPLHVVDIAHGDRVTSFAAAAAAGIWGVIHKATTGATGKDERYQTRRQAALDAGLLWGAYHWGTNAPVADQVENFLTSATPDAQTLVALDYEDTPGNQMTLDEARAFLTRINERLGRKAVLYSGHLIKEQLGDTQDAFFGSHRLWLAQYTPPPVVQASWETYWLWQYTDNTKSKLLPNTVAGIPGDDKGNLDCNSYDDTREELTAQWAS